MQNLSFVVDKKPTRNGHKTAICTVAIFGDQSLYCLSTDSCFAYTVMPENQKCISEMGESLLPKQATFSHKFYTVNECHRASKVTHLL